MSCGSITSHLTTEWLQTTVTYFIPSCADWLGLADSCQAQLGGCASSCGSGWCQLLVVRWAQACFTRSFWDPGLRDSRRLAWGSSAQGDESGTGAGPATPARQASASITPANSLLVPKVTRMISKSSCGDIYFCPEGGQSE